MTFDVETTLLDALRTHNPWWDDGADAFDLPARPRSDFYHLARPGEDGSQFADQRVLGLVGRRGVGKTTLALQFVHDQLTGGAAPERFCYLPLDANPLFQLRSATQLRRALQYYEGRVLDRAAGDGPHFVVLDDVNRAAHRHKPNVASWSAVVTEFLGDRQDRHVVVTAPTAVQLERELEDAAVPPGDYDVQPIFPEKFRDYLFSLHRDLETDEAKRVSPTSIRTGPGSLPAALETGDPEPLAAELRRKLEQVAGDADRIRPPVVEYLAMGGLLSYAEDGVVADASQLDEADYEQLRADTRHALYQDVPDFESIQTLADLERLAALAAAVRAREPLRYRDLADVFDVDRRTLTASYLSALSALYVLSDSTEYGNQRPRAAKLYLRDPGLATALAQHDHEDVVNDLRLETEYARLVAYDHTKRLTYGVNASQGHVDDDWRPDVWYWDRRASGVDYVFEVRDTPVPVALAYQPGSIQGKTDAVRAFRDAFDTPLGLVLTGDTARRTDDITESDGVIQLPYWLYLLLC